MGRDDNELGWTPKHGPVFFLFSGKEETVKGFMSLLLSCSVWPAGSPHTPCAVRFLIHPSPPTSFRPRCRSCRRWTVSPLGGARRGSAGGFGGHVRGAGLHRKKSSISAWGLTITRTAFADGGGGGVG